MAVLRLRMWITSGIVALGPGLAAAQGGVVEINSVRAAAGGVTPSDTPEFPVTLDTPGSYRLTSNLRVPDENTTAIQVTAPGVHIDLGGFVILGSSNCSGDPFPCGPTGSGVGIDASSVEDASVENGSVRQMGSHGVNLGTSGRLWRVHATRNAGTGLAVGSNGLIEQCTAVRNAGHGILASFGGTVRSSTAESNGADGIHATARNVVEGNTARDNRDNGIFAGASTISGNTVAANQFDGIDTGFGSNGSTVVGNAAFLNGGFGLNLDAFSGYSNNVLTGNNGVNPEVDSGVAMGCNVLNGVAVCPP